MDFIFTTHKVNIMFSHKYTIEKYVLKEDFPGVKATPILPKPPQKKTMISHLGFNALILFRVDFIAK